MSWVCLFFPVKGRDRGTECALLSPCLFELFKFCREAVSPPPIFLKLHDSPAKSNRACWGQQLHAPYAAVLFFCLMYKCVLVCAHLLFCLYFDRILEDIPLKKRKKKKKIKKNKGSMAINSFKKTMENSA